MKIAILILLAFGCLGTASWGQWMPAGTVIHRDLPYVEDGHERQRLDVYIPPGTKSPLPAIVWVHGGGWHVGSKDRPNRALPFLGKGYVVVSINYRLSQHAIFPAQIEDCKAAIRWLRAHADTYSIDPDHIGVWGASAGAHLAALLGTTGDVDALEGKAGPLDQSSRVQAVVDWYGPTDLTQMGGWHNNPDSPESRLIGGPVQENREKAARADPVTYISKDDAPFLVMHGDQDKTVIFSQSEYLVAALKEAGVEVTFRRVAGAGHGGKAFHGAENRELMAQIEAFFNKHLKAGS